MSLDSCWNIQLAVSEFGIKILIRGNMKSMGPSCHGSTVQAAATAAGVMMCLGPFIPAERGLNTTAHESIVNMD